MPTKSRNRALVGAGGVVVSAALGVLATSSQSAHAQVPQPMQAAQQAAQAAAQAAGQVPGQMPGGQVPGQVPQMPQNPDGSRSCPYINAFMLQPGEYRGGLSQSGRASEEGGPSLSGSIRGSLRLNAGPPLSGDGNVSIHAVGAGMENIDENLRTRTASQMRVIGSNPLGFSMAVQGRYVELPQQVQGIEGINTGNDRYDFGAQSSSCVGARGNFRSEMLLRLARALRQAGVDNVSLFSNGWYVYSTATDPFTTAAVQLTRDANNNDGTTARQAIYDRLQGMLQTIDGGTWDPNQRLCMYQIWYAAMQRNMSGWIERAINRARGGSYPQRLERLRDLAEISRHPAVLGTESCTILPNPQNPQIEQITQALTSDLQTAMQAAIRANRPLDAVRIVRGVQLLGAERPALAQRYQQYVQTAVTSLFNEAATAAEAGNNPVAWRNALAAARLAAILVGDQNAETRVRTGCTRAGVCS